MRRWSTIAIAGGVLVGACVDLQPYACGDDDACTSADAGVCEASGHCSYPDAECDSGRRYGDLAGEGLANQCTSVVETSGTTASSESGPVATIGSTTAGASSSGSAGSSESTGPLPLPVCGDGMVEGDEECDEPDDVDGDGCNTDCVRSGSPRWSAVVASDSGNDRLFGLTQLVTGDVVAVGYVQAASRDVIIVRYTVDGDEVQRIVHDVDGGTDEAEAVVQGGTGRLYVCGRATLAGVSRPWVGRWDALLPALPDYEGEVPAPVEGYCHDITYVSSSQIVAVGGSGGQAWTWTFADGSLGAGEAAMTAPAGASRFKEVVRAPDASVTVAGQLGDLGVVMMPPSDTDLGLPFIETVEQIELQSMIVGEDAIVVGGLARGLGFAMDDLWVAAYELDGAERWRFVGDFPAIDEVEDVAVDPAGNVFATGHVVSEAPDRWVAKLDPAGQLVWQRHDYPGSDGDDRGRSIEVLPDGDLMLVAEIIGEGGDQDGWIARLAP